MQTLHPEVFCSFSVVGNLCSSTLSFKTWALFILVPTRGTSICLHFTKSYYMPPWHAGNLASRWRVMQENGDMQCVSEPCTSMAPSTTQYLFLLDGTWIVHVLNDRARDGSHGHGQPFLETMHYFWCVCSTRKWGEALLTSSTLSIVVPSSLFDFRKRRENLMFIC